MRKYLLILLFLFATLFLSAQKKATVDLLEKINLASDKIKSK